MTTEQLEELFEKHSATDYLKFDRIPENQRRHSRPDLCALLLLDERFPDTKNRDIIDAAEHDIYYLGVAPDGNEWPLTEDDVIILTRCGFGWDSDIDCFYSFA